MGQTLVFKADQESPLTDHQVRRLVAVLRSLVDYEEGFERLHVEIEADSALDLAFPSEVEVEEGGEEGVETEKEIEEEEEVEEEGVEAEAEEEALSIEERREQQKESDELPTLNPGTRRYTLASILYHADGYLTTSEIVELSQDEDWEMGQSGASAELYNMFQDVVVHRRQRGGDGSYEYWLSDDGIEALEQSDEAIQPDPFDQE